MVAERKIRLLRGSVVVAGATFRQGETFPVSEELFAWLGRKQSATLRFEEVAPVVVVPPSEEDLEDKDKDLDQEGDDRETAEGATHTGEGEDLTGGGEGEETTGASVPAPASSTDTSASSGPMLAAIDSKISAALAAAGWDTVEKLAGATVEDLVKVPGIGKIRAEAILSEVRG